MDSFLNPHVFALALHNAARLTFLVMTPNRHNAINVVNDMALAFKVNGEFGATRRQGRRLVVVEKECFGLHNLLN